MGSVVNRRAFLLAMAPVVACRRAAEGFRGYAFVANRDGRSVAVVDLNTFRVRKSIPIDGHPTAVISHWRRPAIYVLTPETGTVHEIDPVSLSVRRKARAMNSAISMRLSPDGGSLWLLSPDSRTLAHPAAGRPSRFRPFGRLCGDQFSRKRLVWSGAIALGQG